MCSLPLARDLNLFVAHTMIGSVVSHYKILEKLGEGGMGEVYKATDLKLNRMTALKFLPAYFSKDEDAKQRFIHEAQNASSLDHPNICTIFEIDETRDSSNTAAGRLFIAMAFYDGVTLKQKIQQRSMSPSDVIDIAAQVASGLAKAHQRGIIHRDVKPENVMVTNDGIAKIVDFGLARFAGRTGITRPGITMGTLSYISPEQIQGKKVDHRTDIWSFGVLLYEMLTGELPFRGEIDQARIYSILNEAPEPLRIRVPEKVKKVLHRTLQKDPRDRYSSMEEVITDLKTLEVEGGHPRTEKPKTSIAVLPFKNMSEDRSQEYFCDGMAEELINALTAVQDLRVIARTSSFSFKRKQIDIREIGRKLNVEMILEGSIRKTENRLRITAQLINVSDGSHLWSGKFDRTLEDVLALQDEISLLIVDKLRIGLMADERSKMTSHGTDNLEAYNLYLLGRFNEAKHSRPCIERAIEYYRKAIDKDEKFLMPYFLIAANYGSLMAYYHSLSEHVARSAADVVERVQRIAPDSIPAHLALANYHLNFTRDWDTARMELEKLKELKPDNESVHQHLSIYYFYVGDFDKAILEAELGRKNDPLRVESIVRLGVCYLRARKTREARQQFLLVTELEPDFYLGYWLLGQTDVLDSHCERGIELLTKALALSNEDEYILADLVRAYALAGDKGNALQRLDRLISRNQAEQLHPYTFVSPYCALGRLDEAFQWMEKALEQRDPAFVNLFTAESLDTLRADPRFGKLLTKFGFEKYYRPINETPPLPG
jgi:eukaryotic-like serine/threonine-protein kinase